MCPDGVGDIRGCQASDDHEASLHQLLQGALEGLVLEQRPQRHGRVTEAFQNALSTGQRGTEYGDGYFFITPRMQTGDPRYAWVNNIACVGQGRLQSGRAEYNVYQVVN